MRENYPLPAQLGGNSASVASIHFTFTQGPEELQRRLFRAGDEVAKHVYGTLHHVGQEIASAANAAAHRSKRKWKGRRGGALARSFGAFDRTRVWAKYGLIGVAVRSRASYHWYQEFGVQAPDRQVVLHRNALGATVKKGARYRVGTKRLADGVRVTTYRRDIHNPAHPILGPVFSSMRSQAEADIQQGVSTFLRRITWGGGVG